MRAQPTPPFRSALIAVFAAASLSCGGPGAEELRSALESAVAAADPSDRAVDQARPFYEQRNFSPVWVAPHELTPRGAALIETLSEVDHRGLPGYRLVEIHDGYRAAYGEGGEDSPERLAAIARLELDLSGAVVEMVRDVLHGRSNLPKVQRNWHYRVERNSLDTVDLLARFSATDDPESTLETLRDDHPGYGKLREALERYHEIAEEGGWQPVTVEPGVDPSSGDPRLETVRARLEATGDLTRAAGDLRGALDRFRARHGLPPADEVDRAVIDAMNVPVEDRIAQLEINLERQRWLPKRKEGDRVVVNIPEFKLHGYRDGEHRLEMAVVVGKSIHQTPVFADEMTYVTFRPYWNVPESIALDEILPKLRDNESYLAQNGYDVVDPDENVVTEFRLDDRDRRDDVPILEEAIQSGELRIRQAAGPANALGLIKFMFPNEFNVYLHDTPADHLFEKTQRDFSHGCVRVEDPPRFARFVLEGQEDGTAAEIERKLQDPEIVSEEVPLERPLPVYIVYLTAWVDHEGVVQFRDDVYGHDKAVRDELREDAYTEAEVAQFEQLRDLLAKG